LAKKQFLGGCPKVGKKIALPQPQIATLPNCATAKYINKVAGF
jgi:hypothetical protein